MFGVVNSQCHSQYIFNSVEIHKNIGQFVTQKCYCESKPTICFIDNAFRAFDLKNVGRRSCTEALSFRFVGGEKNETLN